MPYTDLREYLHRLREEGELANVAVEVDPKFEVGAICRKVLNKRGPALFFERLKGSSVPMVTDLFGTRKRFALALQTTVDKVHEEWVRRTRVPIDPVIVATGSCKENIFLGDEADIFKFPIPTWNELDGGPFLTFSIHHSRDPVTGKRNAAVYRNQVFDGKTVGILAAPFRHLAMHRSKQKGQPFPVAITIGVDPSLCIAAVAPFAFGVEELAMAGALRGAPVELVRCETVPLEVPATADIVIEGWIHPNDVREEGPFGEYTGYYGRRRPKPVIRISAVTHRNNPIHQGTYVGRPPGGSEALTPVPIEAEIRRLVSLPGIDKIHVTMGGARFNVIISIEKLCEGYGKMVAMAVLGSWAGRHIKNLIIVDNDIDPENWDEVEWAIATRVQPHRDVEIIGDLLGSALDPSILESEKSSGYARTSKMVIDATRYDAKSYELACSPDRDTMKRVEEQWARYGLPF